MHYLGLDFEFESIEGHEGAPLSYYCRMKKTSRNQGERIAQKIISGRKKRLALGWRSFLVKEWEREVKWILFVQQFRNPVLDVFFTLASLLGDEVFYISFLPFCNWMWGFQSAAHMTLLMSLNIGIGNICKNLLSLPRPNSPPVWLNSSPQLDHGMPSTHTMSAVSVPFYFVYYLYFVQASAPSHFSLSTATVIGVIWAISVAFSRIYNGHHSPMDVAMGALLASILLAFHINVFRHVVDDSIASTSVFVPLGWFIGGALLLYMHNVPKHLTPAFGESGLVVGTGVGVIASQWTYHNFGLPGSLWNADPMPGAFVQFLRTSGAIWLIRFLIGASIVMIVRVVFKKIFMHSVNTYIFPNSKLRRRSSSSSASSAPAAAHDSELRQEVHDFFHPHPRHHRSPDYSYATPHYFHPYSEVIVKYLTYIMISVSAVVIAPMLFVIMGVYASVDYPYQPVPSYAFW